MKLPQHYKRWPALRSFDTCQHMRGDLNSGFHRCGKKATVLVAPAYGNELLGFVELCTECYEKVSANVLTRAQWIEAKETPHDNSMA